MFEVFFYKDKSGRCPVLDYIRELAGKGDKDNRIKVNKIRDYIKYLREVGPQAREPYAKHLGGGIWELRPIRDRILYAALVDQRFILLHCFTKDTQKTPQREIERAKRNLADHKERGSK
jgi:phage-related protein